MPRRNPNSKSFPMVIWEGVLNLCKTLIKLITFFSLPVLASGVLYFLYLKDYKSALVYTAVMIAFSWLNMKV